MSDATLYIDLVLYAAYALMAAAVVAVGYGVWHGISTHSGERSASDTRYAAYTGYGVAVGVVIVLLLTWLFASTEPLVVNGKQFTDTRWLRLTDMFLLTSILLIIVCSVLVVAAKFRR
jgi:cytochrome b561